jgi:pilus assembly protein CpaC
VSPPPFTRALLAALLLAGLAAGARAQPVPLTPAAADAPPPAAEPAPAPVPAQVPVQAQAQAQAQVSCPAGSGANPIEQRRISIEAGAGQLATLHTPATNVFVADPKVVSVRPGSTTTLFIFGVGPGHTTVAALDDCGGAVAQYDVTVRPSLFLAARAEQAIAQVVPNSHVRVIPQPKGLLVSGRINNPQDAARVLAVAKSFLPEGQAVEDQLAVAAPVQVTLKVRIAEMSRTVTRNLGINWQALGTIGSFSIMGGVGSALSGLAVNSNTSLGGSSTLPFCGGGACRGFGFSGLIDALAEDNLAHVLAEPNLTVMSGQSASFLAGGEFPIPTGQQNGQITVTFKRFGVNLDFTPTVLADGRINLKVRPEVSQLSNIGAVTVPAGNASITIPALTVRRAETTVELGSGQSFAIAGLLQDSSTQANSGLPGLGDVPVLGALFRSDQFQRNQTELVILVTPYIATPVSDPGRLRLAGANFVPPTDLERVFGLRQVSQYAAGGTPRQPGFIVQ